MAGGCCVLNMVLEHRVGTGAVDAVERRATSLNHVFIELICLAAVARFLVNRANHVSFFLASFLPMAVAAVRALHRGGNTVDLILAAVVVLYAIQVVLDSSQISQRWDQEAQTRFSHEDLSRELEEARDEALIKRAEAETANASKTAFLANMSHELRTPLNAILGFSEIIARECFGPVGSPRYKEYAGDIHSSGTHLLSLINDLLDVAKIEAGRMEIEPQMVETERTLDIALKFVGARRATAGQTLTITVDQSAAVLYADERALKQIVINLVSNAVKFTPAMAAASRSPRKRNAQGDFELIVARQRSGHPAREARPHLQAVHPGGQSLRSPGRRHRAWASRWCAVWPSCMAAAPGSNANRARARAPIVVLPGTVEQIKHAR